MRYAASGVSMIDAVAQRIAATFNRLYGRPYRTLLVGGGAEPWYEPPVGDASGRIVYRHDYPASALHEAAHWCLAGARRRRLRDYGYWYVPGPRNAEQRSAFFAVEARVQGLEAVLAGVCDVRFVVSADDFAAPQSELDAFAGAVDAAIASLRRDGLPTRAAALHDALAAEFHDG